MSAKPAKSAPVDQNAPTEQAPSTALTVAQRAAVALNSPEHEKKLAELAKASVSITSITNTAGYEQCHAARMALKKVRVDIEKIGKSAREDATAFSKACIAEKRRLIGIIEPEETRLERIQREWDEARRREKEAKEAAERQRVAAIQERIDWIRQQALDAAGETAAQIEERIQAVVALEIDASFAELERQAEGAKTTTLIRLRSAHAKALAFEEEQNRLAEERAELARQREAEEARQAAERARLAEEERQAKAAREAEEKRAREAREAERQRIAAEDAALQERIRVQRAEEARLETERQAEAQRLADERAQLERDQEALRLEREKPTAEVVPLPQKLTVGEELPEVSVTVGGESIPSTLETTTEPETQLATINFQEWLAMQTVCRYAKEWAAFQDPDSKEEQKKDRKLKAQAQEAAINLLVAVEALP